MKYYTNSDNTEIYAEPTEMMITALNLSEYYAPVWQGKYLPEHENLSQVQTKEDGTFYEFYNADGTADATAITEKERSEFRAERDRLLAETDYMMSVDYYNNILTAEQQTELTNYRQALRDSTNTWTLPAKPAFTGG